MFVFLVSRKLATEKKTLTNELLLGSNLHNNFFLSCCVFYQFEKNGSKNIEERRLGTILVKAESTSPTIETLRVEISNQSKDTEIEELKLKITELDRKLHEVSLSYTTLKSYS